LKGEIEKKNNFNKKKRMRTRLVKIICHKFRLKDKIYKKNTEGKRKKINQDNED
jgi:hypothetical protein